MLEYVHNLVRLVLNFYKFIKKYGKKFFFLFLFPSLSLFTFLSVRKKKQFYNFISIFQLHSIISADCTMAPSTPSKVCSRCCVMSPNSDYIKCGMCKKSFHLCLEQFKKINLSLDLKSKVELSGFRYLCVNCLPALNAVSASYKSISDRLDALTSIVSDLASIVREIKKPLTDEPSTSSGSEPTSLQLFSDVMKESTLVLKPKDANANSDELKNLVMDNIDPEESNISGIRQTSSNCIILKSCVQDSKAFADHVDSKLGSNFSIKVHNDDIRRIKIINVEYGDSTDEDIVKSIRAQNCNVISDASKVSILRRLPYNSNTNMGSLIVEVDIRTHKNLLSQGKINIKWTRCRVYDALVRVTE